MIYKDKFSFKDHAHIPGNRKETCINCGKEWDFHRGWSCDIDAKSPDFNKNDASKRYLTKCMLESLDEKVITPAVKEHKPKVKTHSGGILEMLSSDWRDWQHKEDGHCPCGIVRNICSYHK